MNKYPELVDLEQLKKLMQGVELSSGGTRATPSKTGQPMWRSGD